MVVAPIREVGCGMQRLRGVKRCWPAVEKDERLRYRAKHLPVIRIWQLAGASVDWAVCSRLFSSTRLRWPIVSPTVRLDSLSFSLINFSPPACFPIPPGAAAQTVGARRLGRIDFTAPKLLACSNGGLYWQQSRLICSHEATDKKIKILHSGKLNLLPIDYSV